MTKQIPAFVSFLLFVLSVPVWTQTNPQELSVLEVKLPGTSALQFKATELQKLPRKTVQAKRHDGKVCLYEGVELREILTRAGVKFGKELRGKWLHSALLVQAADQYQTIFALPELDDVFTNRVILLADRCDGKALPAGIGPFQIIVPDEQRHARWVKNVAKLVIVPVTVGEQSQ